MGDRSVDHQSVESWIQSRRPRIPPSFRPHLLGEREGAADPMELLSRGEDALAGALAHSGRPREAAFDLLVADAYLTYACEATAREEDVMSGLEALLRHLGSVVR